MKCKLGEKKLRKCSKILGVEVIKGFVRGGWTHFWAMCFDDYGYGYWVNYKTGEIARK